jgi:hypothetical protein
MAQERYIAVYPPALKLPAGGNPATHALEQGMAAWSQQLQQWLSQEVSKILGQATDHGQQIDALENVGKIKARAYRNAAQNIGPGPTKILIDTISFDTEGVVDIANSLIVPNLPGYYVVMGNAGASTVPDGMMVNALIHKNGALVTYGTIDNHGAAGRSSSSVSDLIYMDGTTDYLELFVHSSHSSALALYVGNSYQNYISIVGPF